MTLRASLKAHSHYLAIICGVTLAWLPTLYRHIPIADDYPLMKLYQNGLGSYVEAFGIWRILGHTTPYLSALFGPYFFGGYALIFHLLAVGCFYKVAALLLDSSRLALTLSLVMGLFPWGFQALMWESSLQVVIATFLFYANIYILLSSRRQFPALVICSLLTLIALLTNEYLVFSFIVSGLIVWLDGGELSLRRVRERYSGFAPLIGCGVYLILYRVYSATVVYEYKHPSFNPRSFFSSYYYQYSNLDIFGSLLQPDTRRLMFSQWEGWMAFAVLLLGVAFLWFLASVRSRRREAGLSQSGIGYNKLLYIVILMAGASLVYTMAGGFSYDSRKKYPFVPLILLFAGWFWRRFVPGLKFSKKSFAALVMACALGIATTWTIVGVWRYESERHRALIEYLTNNRIGGEVNLISEPDLYSSWPTMFRTLGFRFDDEWVVNRELESRNNPTIRISRNPQALALYYNSSGHFWQR